MSDSRFGPSDLPRLLVFSEGALSRSHGTGTIFSRNFAFYPNRRLTNWFIGNGKDAFVPDNRNLSSLRWEKSLKFLPEKIWAKLWNRLVSTPRWPVPINTNAIAQMAKSQPFRPDVVYAIVYSRDGIDTLRGVVDGLSFTGPLILQIQDFFPSQCVGISKALKKIAPHVTEVWGVSYSILDYVRPALNGIPQHFDPLCYIDLPPVAKSVHAPFGNDFRTLVIGNFWNTSLIPPLVAAWESLKKKLPLLNPIQWHCHPDGVAQVRATGIDLKNIIIPAPFLTGDALFDTLRSADLALIPFSRFEAAENDYERYSMPSRITELCAAGLPFVCLTGRDTPLHRYVSQHNIAKCITMPDVSRSTESLQEIIENTTLRASLGIAARAHAEKSFRLAPHQTWLAEKLCSLANTPTASP